MKNATVNRAHIKRGPLLLTHDGHLYGVGALVVPGLRGVGKVL